MIHILGGTRGRRRRSAARDPIGSVLTGLWALGHVLCLALLGTAVQHHLATSALSHTTALDGTHPRTPHTS
ncbi:hypothetical protein [Kitasatospora phosalacinea]|uniref:Uncharacterized protein n=1 Tax=Kitasatospora phosalacinea TaxID=2065 RepID=A0A9W6UM77_9ACTN|nr:hypothetical protein [Kitasatospora phosalacinea]GLW52902.1 hypothetical protein Kpho01_09130 [Kitasatospora phosalacinea]